MPPPVGKAAVSVAFVRPSVRPSVAYIANNSRTQNAPKFGRKVPRLGCDSHTSFKVKRSKVRVTRPINADTHRAPYLLNGKVHGLRTSKLVYGWRTMIRISLRRHDLQRQKSRSQGHEISLSRVGPVAYKSKTNCRSITKIGRRVPYDMCYTVHQFQDQKVKGQGYRPTNADTQNVPYLPNGKA